MQKRISFALAPFTLLLVGIPLGIRVQRKETSVGVVISFFLVMAYYALAAGAVAHQDATRSIRQNMPDPVPGMVLARLAVDARAQGMKLGAALLQDALQRCVLVSQNTGVRAMLVHALNDRARQFYAHYGFKVSPAHPMTLMLRLNQSSI
jgi:GNAT superfamily N-acetyltransferase